MVVKVVVECALVLKKKKEDDCDEINCHRRFFLRRKCFSEIASRVTKDKKREGCVKILYDKRFDFRQVITNKIVFKR